MYVRRVLSQRSHLPVNKKKMYSLKSTTKEEIITLDHEYFILNLFRYVLPIPTLKKKGKNLNRIKFQSYLKTFRADTPPRGITIPFDRQIPRISIPTAHRISPPSKDLTLKRFSSPPFGGGSDRTLF